MEKGTVKVPFFSISPIMTKQEQIASMIDQCLEGTDCFVVEFKVKPTNNYKLYVDSDTGFTLEKCVRINRKLRRLIEEADLYPEGDFSLEVSSPGVDVPLKLERQFKKNVGRTLEIVLQDPEAEGLIGKLLSADETGVQLEKVTKLRRVKKVIPEPEILTILYADIKTAVTQIEF